VKGDSPSPGPAPEPPRSSHSGEFPHLGVGAARSPRATRAAEALPPWLGSIRFRLTALYSLFLFGLAAIVVGGIYLALAKRLDDQPVSQRTVTILDRNGNVVAREVVQAQFRGFEQQVNERALQILRSYSFAALSLLFTSSLAVGWLVAGRVLRPIDRITAVARDIQATDLSRRIDLGGPPDELKDLADTFDAMLSRIDEAFRQQQVFIQEASHELRNPLAVIRTNLDVTLADPNAGVDELRRTGEVVARTAERMSTLVDDLLAYARQGSPNRQFASVDVAVVVSEAAEEFLVPAESRGLVLESIAPDDLWVVGDRVALRQAVTNLLGNAVRLAPDGSRIRVAGGRADDWVWVAVEDQGPGVPEAERDLVFQRFWRGDKRRSREAGRSGLGLTIVRQIAEGHRGQVRLTQNESGGSTFTIWLPAAPAWSKDVTEAPARAV
jgi:signal transduction histidine kinase